MEKAGAMAAVYGRKVGHPLKMSESAGLNSGWFTMNHVSTPMFGEAGGRDSLEALVEVSFALVE